MKKKDMKKQVQQRLAKYRAELTDNIIQFDEDDFGEDGTLTFSSYCDLKDFTKHLPKKMSLVLIVPDKYLDSFLPKLDQYIAFELLSMEKEIKSMKGVSLLLFGTAVIISIIYHYVPEETLFYEIAIVIFWVFVWASVEKLLFDLPTIRNDENKLMQLASSEIITISQYHFRLVVETRQKNAELGQENK